MEIFNQPLCYKSGDLMSVDDQWNKPRLCVSATRRFFDLPNKNALDKAQVAHDAQYVISVHDRKKKQGVAIRIKPSTANMRNAGWFGNDERKVQVEVTGEGGEHIRWSNLSFYHETADMMLSLFNQASKAKLYIVIEAV